MSPDRSYRLVAVPFAGLLVVGGVVLAVVFGFGLAPITSPFPFMYSEVANRIVATLFAVATITFGVGFYLKSRVLWYGFFIYLVVGTLYLCIGVAIDERYVGADVWFLIPFVLLINGAWGVGIHLGTAPAFGEARP